MPQLPPKVNSASASEEQNSEITPNENPVAQAKLEELQSQLDGERKLREQILNDPDMRALLEAKKTGKSVKLMTDEIKEPVIEKKSLRDEFGLKPEAANRDDFNKMSNAEMLEILSDSIESYVASSIEEAVAKSSNVLGGQFKTLQDNQNKLAQALIEQAKRTGADMMSKQYNDFDKYQADAMKLVETNGLTLEDAYILVKSKKAASVPPANEITHERPSFPASRRPNVETQQEEHSRERSVSTTKRFRDLVSSAAENVSQRRLRRQ